MENQKTAWESLALVHIKGRPTVRDYIPLIFTDFYEMHGDRLFGDDGAILGGVGRFQGMPVTVISEVKGRDIFENKASNFAMPHPEGYRKALRLARQAEKFHRPVICFIDTSGKVNLTMYSRGLSNNCVDRSSSSCFPCFLASRCCFNLLSLSAAARDFPLAFSACNCFCCFS